MGVLLALFVVFGCTAEFLEWRAAIDRAYDRELERQPDDWRGIRLFPPVRSDPDAKTLENRYRESGRPHRTGSSTFVFSQGSGATVRATNRMTLTSSDPLLADVRRGTHFVTDWMPFTATLSESPRCRAGRFNQSDLPQVDQKSPKAWAQVTFTSEDELAPAAECGPLLSIETYMTFTLTLKVHSSRLTQHGMYDRWVVSVRPADQDRILKITGGTVLRQSADRVDIALPVKGQVVVTLSAFGAYFERPNDAGTISRALQSSRSGLRDTLFLLAGLLGLLCCLVVPFLRAWAPPATIRRWIGAAVAATAMTALLLLNTLDAFGAGTTTDERPRPADQVMFVAWWWVVLPLLVAALAIRLGSGRPPRPRPFLLLAAPGLFLLAPVAVVSVTNRAPLLFLFVALAALVARVVEINLRSGRLGPPGRRWAATAAVIAGAGVLVCGAGMGLPPAQESWQVADTLVTYAVGWFWPAAALAALTALGLRRWKAVGAALLLWLLVALDSAPPVTQLGPSGFYGMSLAATSQGSQAVNTTLVAVECCVVCVVGAGLWRSRDLSGQWPPYARSAVAAAGVTAALTVPAVSGWRTIGSVYPDGNSLSLALAVATAGFAWLMPASGAASAERLHSTTPRAHLRRVHSLLKEQALAAGRRAFLNTSHTALAEGTLTAREFSTRIRNLGGGAPRRVYALRALALGSSGGRTAWRNGVAAAAFVGMLSLPWIAYTLPPRIASVQAEDPRAVVGEWLTALRWPLYGFVYGYLYSWLRGTTPLGRAMCLLIVVVPAEVAAVLYHLKPPAAFAVTLLLTAGNCLAVFLALGLYWEARQVRAAGLRWGQIRNFRTLSALAVPATTVLVAVATALATTLVSVWTNTSQEPAPLPPETSATSSP